tara:strand:- start:196 stop:468 length:273 start_codon:yes stop_codon:yes gene_type:complete
MNPGGAPVSNHVATILIASVGEFVAARTSCTAGVAIVLLLHLLRCLLLNWWFSRAVGLKGIGWWSPLLLLLLGLLLRLLLGLLLLLLGLT